MAVFVAVRAASLGIVRRLSLDAIERCGKTSESGRYISANWFKAYTNHPRDHARQFEKVIAQ